MTRQNQQLPNEILAPILQYTAFESISWVFYHDIIVLEHETESKIRGLVSCMERLGPKYFAHRVRALWIDITSPEGSLNPEHSASQHSRALHLPFIISACRNIRHLRLFASVNLDVLLQSALALPKLEYLTLSKAFYEPIYGVTWSTLLNGYPSPALKSLTHLMMQLPSHPLESSSKFITLFSNLTHVGFYITGDLAEPPDRFMIEILRMRFLEKVVLIDPPHIPAIIQGKDEGYYIRWNEWMSWINRAFWRNGLLERSGIIHVVNNEPKFGKLEEWRSLILAKRFPELVGLSVWNRHASIVV
ncbi:hypothetical protein DL96DRAFT_1713606 [Flagelloscypha sp. PMI_526]|nr:hypothetical protein DL96DRAFT_1713606 [Flagelloscypha sp. PMI_526]